MSVLSSGSTLAMLAASCCPDKEVFLIRVLFLLPDGSFSSTTDKLGGGFKAKPRKINRAVKALMYLKVGLRPKFRIEDSSAGAVTKNPRHEPLVTRPIASALLDSKYMFTLSMEGRIINPRLIPVRAP